MVIEVPGVEGVRGVRGVKAFAVTITRCLGVTGANLERASRRLEGVRGVGSWKAFAFSSATRC